MISKEPDITEALQKLLKKEGKDYLSFSNVKKKMGAALKKQLGIKSSYLPATIKTLLEPYLGETLEILKGGRSTYLAVRRAPEAWVLGCLSPNAARGAGALSRLLPIFSKARLAGVLNGLLREGRVAASLNEKCEARLSLPDETHRPKMPSEHTAPVEVLKDKNDEFWHVFDELERQRLFVRICDLRRRLLWTREAFDKHLRRLRQEGAIQLHIADANLMSQEDIEDGFIDENGFRMGMVTRHGK